MRDIAPCVTLSFLASAFCVSRLASRARTEALDALHYATLAIGDPQPIREQVENLRDLLTALWLLYEAALIAVDRHQQRY